MNDDFIFNEYMVWLMDHAVDYGKFVCNGDMLLDIAEGGVGYQDFLKDFFSLDNSGEPL